jgi:hypothetical protein
MDKLVDLVSLVTLNCHSTLDDLCHMLIKSLITADISLVADIFKQIITLLDTDPVYKKYRFDLVNFTLEEKTVTKFIRCFLDILPILNVQVILNTSDGKAQNLQPSSIGTCLQNVLLDNYHNVIHKCSKYDDKKGTCKGDHPFIKPKMHQFTCEYHAHDSLATHLVLASIMSGFKAITDPTLTDHDITILQLIALIHDIGKVVTVQAYEYKKLVTAFPFHGEVGRLILLPFYCPEMGKFVSEQEFLAICDTVGRHMCGYHGEHEGGNIYKRDLLCSESDLVKSYLSNLRYGDHFGKLPSDNKLENQEEFVNSSEPFEKAIGQKFELNAFFDKYGFTKNKMVIYLLGTSGAGKGYICGMIQNFFHDLKVDHVERDVCMSLALTGLSKRFLGKTYADLYKIYDVSKELFRTKRSDKKKYAELEQKLILTQNSWNDQYEDKVKVHVIGADPIDIASQVNNLLKQKIQEGLDDPKCRIIVIDTMMNMFPGIEQHIPDVVKNCFIVHIHVHNFCRRLDGNNIGGTIDQQLAVCGPFDIMHPLNPGSMRQLKAMSSVSTDLKSHASLKIVPECFQSSPFRPHLVTNVCRTEHGSIGYTHVLEILRKFILSTGI